VLAGLAMWRHEPRNELAQSCPCVRLTHGLGRVGSTVANVLKFSEDCANAFKARLDKKKFGCIKQLNLLVGSGCVPIFPLGFGWVSQTMVGLDRVRQNGPTDNSQLASTHTDKRLDV